MTTLKAKEIKNMTEQERKKRLEELKMEMIKARVDASKKGGSKIRQIKKLIARILTIERMSKEARSNNGNMS